MPKQLRKSDIVRLIQFASWSGNEESVTYGEAEDLLDDFLERMGVPLVDLADPEDEMDQELDELGLL